MDHLDLNLPQAAGETEDSSSLELQGNFLYFICHRGVPPMSLSVCLSVASTICIKKINLLSVSDLYLRIFVPFF
jgi:hypothetical protein